MTEFCGVPIVRDGDEIILRAPDEASACFPVDRACSCDPATLVGVILYPRPGFQCQCGAVWPIRFDVDTPPQLQ